MFDIIVVKQRKAVRKVKPKVEITKQCSLCEVGRPSPDGRSVLCIKHGVMPLESVCRSFCYDPLKREPKLPPRQQFDKAEFEL